MILHCAQISGFFCCSALEIVLLRKRVGFEKCRSGAVSVFVELRSNDRWSDFCCHWQEVVGVQALGQRLKVVRRMEELAGLVEEGMER